MKIHDHFSDEEINRLMRISAAHRVNRWLMPMLGVFAFLMTLCLFTMTFLVIRMYNIEEPVTFIAAHCKPREMYPGTMVLVKEFVLLGMFSFVAGVYFFLDPFGSRERLLVKCWQMLRHESRQE